MGEGWCHEGKRGWRCKIAKMVDAGWCFDPSPETEDGVTCFYCNLSLDGWEPKDDPFEEHRRRSPECPFFALVERYHGTQPTKKGKGKGKARGSTASRASRLSTQSTVSVMSEAPSMAPSLELGEVGADFAEEMAGVDDSIMTTGTVTSQAGGKGKKKGTKGKAAAKGAKGKKGAVVVHDNENAEALYPDLGQPSQLQPAEEPEDFGTALEEPAQPPAQVTRKGSRQSKQPLDSSTTEVSQSETAIKTFTRGRKPKVRAAPEPEPEFEMKMTPEPRESQVSAQLERELEQSFDQELPDAEATPQPAPATKPKRGVKRSSTGVPKQRDSSMVSPEFPVPSQPAAKGKKGGKKAKASVATAIYQDEAPSEPAVASQDTAVDSDMSQMVSEAAKPKATKIKKGPAKRGRPKKGSSTRSSRATVMEDEQEDPRHEDLERDEREIEAELERMAAEQRAQEQLLAVQQEQDAVAEFELSPSHKQQHVDRIHELEQELHAETEHLGNPGQNLTDYVATVAASPQPPLPVDQAPDVHHGKENATPTPSPSGSDKENQPSSLAPQTAMKAAPILSPTKTVRIPLAPGTPNRPSPSKHLLLSPNKQLSKFTSTSSWTAVDLDTVLLASPQPTPGRLGQQLIDAAGTLTSPEKKMSVEEWVRWRAERGEEELRRRCEGLVGRFEREGVRALESLGGVVVG